MYECLFSSGPMDPFGVGSRLNLANLPRGTSSSTVCC
uniref:Uncharacterized protein n=1 Tax=Anguilla anguilla TaxID=7936 RepID=A0A0E9VUR5_ANGAN